MLRILAVAVLLSACATSPSAPAQYERGTYPTAPTFNPAQGAPHTIGQPGHLRAPLPPRSPNKRVLPPSTVPGIWASDRADPAPRPSNVVFGVDLPVPDDKFEQTPVYQCLGAMHSSIKANPVSAAVIEKASAAARKCIARRTLSTCLTELLSNAEGAKSQGVVFHQPAFAALTRVARSADRAKLQVCSGVTLTDEEHDAWIRIDLATVASSSH